MDALRFNKEQLRYFSDSLSSTEVLKFYVENGNILCDKEVVEEDVNPYKDIFECKSIEVVINGKKLLLDTENVVFEGNEYFSFAEALEIAKNCGKRLLTEKEARELCKYANEWQMESPEKPRECVIRCPESPVEAHFPLMGGRLDTTDRTFSYSDIGYYWVGTGADKTNFGREAPALKINMFSKGIVRYSIHNRFSLRLVRDI